MALIAAAHAGEIEVLDSRRFGGAYVLDQLWERLGVGAALHPLPLGVHELATGTT